MVMGSQESGRNVSLLRAGLRTRITSFLHPPFLTKSHLRVNLALKLGGDAPALPGAAVSAWVFSCLTVYRSLGLCPNAQVLPGNLEDENTIENVKRETSPKEKV